MTADDEKSAPDPSSGVVNRVSGVWIFNFDSKHGWFQSFGDNQDALVEEYRFKGGSLFKGMV